MAKVEPLDLPLPVIRNELDSIRHPFRIAIERAKNPFNIGSIVRTAHSFLVKEIILIGSEPWYERAAMGMQRFENITEMPSTESFIERAARENFSAPASSLTRRELILPSRVRSTKVAR